MPSDLFAQSPDEKVYLFLVADLGRRGAAANLQSPLVATCGRPDCSAHTASAENAGAESIESHQGPEYDAGIPWLPVGPV
jgi:hypothetical protein